MEVENKDDDVICLVLIYLACIIMIWKTKYYQTDLWPRNSFDDDDDG